MRILVVEDEQDLNNVICNKLRASGYSVDSCLNGEDALDYIRRHRLAKDEVLYVGDSHIDSLTAQRAGIDLAMCEWKRLCNPQRYPARYYCSRPEQILSIWQENRRGLCMAEG